MNMPVTQNPLLNVPLCLRDTLRLRGTESSSFICDEEQSISRADLASGSILNGRPDELRGQCVIVITASQLTATMVLIELDGIARRLVVYPNESSLDHLPYVIEATGADAIVSDVLGLSEMVSGIRHFAPTPHIVGSEIYDHRIEQQTEWITFTSGTTGRPKLAGHTLSSLVGAISSGGVPATETIWSTFYDIRRFGGLQVFLRALMSGSTLVLSSASETPAQFLTRAGSYGITHISGTPSHWRRALMSGSAKSIAPTYIRLSGEIVDQGILDHLRSEYPAANIVHAFGSSEAGTVFEVRDGLAGFPADLLRDAPKVEMKVEADTLRVRSGMAAYKYLGSDAPPLKDADGFVDTGDLVELRDGRYYFVGRRDGRINVGGLKVHPEEIETILNRHPAVLMSQVRAKKNPITGAVVAAALVLRAPLGPGSAEERLVQESILRFCREFLPPHKTPALIRFVPALAIAASGKIVRSFPEETNAVSYSPSLETTISSSKAEL